MTFKNQLPLFKMYSIPSTTLQTIPISLYNQRKINKKAAANSTCVPPKNSRQNRQKMNHFEEKIKRRKNAGNLGFCSREFLFRFFGSKQFLGFLSKFDVGVSVGVVNWTWLVRIGNLDTF
jgi:hypothetical protein